MENKNFKILIFGQLTSLLGSSIQKFAFSLFILKTTGSIKLFSLILMLGILPTLLLVPVSGHLADKMNKKRSMITLDLLSFITVLVLGIAVSMGQSGVVVIGIGVVILSVLTSFYQPVVQSSVPIIVKQDKLHQANGMVSMAFGLSNLLGPILAAILYSTYGIIVVLVINGVTFLISAFSELFFDFKSPIRNKMENSFRKDTREAFNYIKNSKVILEMAKVAIVVNFLIAPFFMIVVPVMVLEYFAKTEVVYGFSEAGIAFSMIAGGALSSKLLMGKKNHEFFPKTFFRMAVVFIAMSALLYLYNGAGAVGGNIIFILINICLALIMFMMTLLNISAITSVQRNTSIELLGKVMAFISSLSLIFIPIGQIVFGYVLDLYMKYTFVVTAFVAIAIMLISLSCKISMKNLDSKGEEKWEIIS